MVDPYAKLSPELRAKIEADDARSLTPEGRYGLGKRVEYRVKLVTRYVVTKFEADVEPEGYGSAGTQKVKQVSGEYPNWDMAYAVAYALCKADHQRLGYEPCDMRIQYPVSAPNGTEMSLDPAFHSEEEISSIGKAFVNAEGEVEAR